MPLNGWGLMKSDVFEDTHLGVFDFFFSRRGNLLVGESVSAF